MKRKKERVGREIKEARTFACHTPTSHANLLSSSVTSHQYRPLHSIELPIPFFLTPDVRTTQHRPHRKASMKRVWQSGKCARFAVMGDSTIITSMSSGTLACAESPAPTFQKPCRPLRHRSTRFYPATNVCAWDHTNYSHHCADYPPREGVCLSTTVERST